MIQGRTIHCDCCGAIKKFAELFDVCYDESELQEGPIQEGKNPEGMFVDVSQGWGLETMADHWCLDCWDKNTAPKMMAPRKWVSEAAPLLHRLVFEEDTIETLHLKIVNQPYVRSRHSV